MKKIKILKARASGRQLRDLDAFLAHFCRRSGLRKRNYDQTRITEAVHKGLRMLEALSDGLRNEVIFAGRRVYGGSARRLHA